MNMIFITLQRALLTSSSVCLAGLVLLVGLAVYNGSLFAGGRWALPDISSDIDGRDLRVLLGLLIVVQGFDVRKVGEGIDTRRVGQLPGPGGEILKGGEMLCGYQRSLI